ncbi:MAG: hypothetical protein HDQ96_16040 [Lachnospiraceae bacterium]|nr:hypothetical protein [Lachnospiraceae bacterium]
MKANAKRLLAVLCGVMMLCVNGIGVLAQEEEIVKAWEVSEYQEPTGDNVAHGIYDIPDMSGAKAATLTNCTIGISVSASGVSGSITTGSTVKASAIGIKDIRVEKYVNGKWTLVGSSAGGSTTNDNSYAMNVSTTAAQKGVQYRISCTHYAVLEGVKHELYNVTDGVSY